MPSISDTLSALRVLEPGELPYADAWALQKRLLGERADGKACDTLILTSHPHVYTLGTSSDANHLLARADELEAAGATVVETDRGGDVTYHGPGQVVGYPIIDLRERGGDVHRYLRDIEEVLIRTAAEFGIETWRDPAYTGVWAGQKKLAAIGVRVSRGVTMHGFALNAGTDLSRFERIIPCGISHKGVTSMEEILGASIVIGAVHEAIVRHFCEIFSCEIR